MFEKTFEHENTKDFDRRFKTNTAKDDSGILTMVIERSVFDEQSAAALWWAVADDLKIIANNLPIEQQPFTIYIVGKLPNGI